MKYSDLKQLIKEAIEEVKPKIEEDVINEGFAPEKDEVGSFFVVEKPTNNSTLKDVCYECKDITHFASKSLNPADIKGVFYNEGKAKKLAEKLLAERDKKKDEVREAGEAYKKMKEETLAKVQEYMKNKKATKQVVDELNSVTK